MLQETLKEFFPSWEQIKLKEEVIVFTCGLMKDPTPLVNYVYETYVEMLCNAISPGSLQRNLETQSRLQALGKDIGDTNLLILLYTESRVPVFGHAHYNQFVYINGNHKGEIDTPSKLYAFFKVSEDDVPVTKFAEQDRSEEAPEYILWIERPEAAAIKNLLSTCYQISKRQPVTHLIIEDVTCEDLTPTESLTFSRNVQVVSVVNCELPMSFWKKILHQLFDCVNLRSLLFEKTNLHLLEENLDELFKNLDSNTETNHQVQVVLNENNFSEKFVNKWNGSRSGISCIFDDNFVEDDFTLDEIKWLIREQVLPRIKINLSGEIITADVVNALEMSEPVEELILRDCSIADGEVFEAFLKIPTNNFLMVLDLSGTKLGNNAIHISFIVAHGNLKQLHLPHCEIPATALDLILPLLPCCNELTHLNLCGNNLETCGHYVAEFIMTLGDKLTLKELNLGHCSMNREACVELLLALGNCKSLTTLNITANSIQGCLNWFLSHPHEGLHSLDKLFLNSTKLNNEDMSHVVQLIEKRKLPMLEELSLGSNGLHTMEAEVENFVGACVTHHTTELKVNICDNDLSDSFVDECKSLCDGTSIDLHFVEHCMDLPSREDESLERFYDHEETNDEYEEIDEEEGDDNQENEIENKDDNTEQETEELMDKVQNKAFEEDKEEVNDKCNDMDNEESNDEENVQQDAREDIHPDGPGVDRDEILEGFCDNYF